VALGGLGVAPVVADAVGTTISGVTVSATAAAVATEVVPGRIVVAALPVVSLADGETGVVVSAAAAAVVVAAAAVVGSVLSA